jgi:tetratricopeptide (TPR) repeat protein
MTPGTAAQRNFTGNSMAINNRTYNFANNTYRPSYYNHPFYHGYWNANRVGYGLGYGGYGYPGYGGLGYGLGYGGLGYGGLSYGLGYGGLGYGLGGLGGWGYGGYGGYGLGYPGYGLFGYAPLGWGLAGWGLGSLLYGSGYLGYSNPYFGGYGGAGGVYNYSQPIPVAYNTATTVGTTVPTDTQGADDILNAAIASFKQNDYDTALNLVNDGIKKYPSDAVMHEFRALVLFAKGDYRQAAATIHSVLAVGPGWDWTTLSSLYPDVANYTTQLRALESAVRQNPDDGAARFLLAYHYMTDGYPDSATQQLQEVVKLVPNDKVATDLLRMLNAPRTTAAGQRPPATNPQPTSQAPAGKVPETSEPLEIPAPAAATSNAAQLKPVDPEAVLGAWKASRPDGTAFELNLKPDKSFSWSFTPKGQSPQSFDGTYTMDGAVLSLERKGGGAMLAAIDLKDPQHFNFKPVGAPPEDPGLDFSK